MNGNVIDIYVIVCAMLLADAARCLKSRFCAFKATTFNQLID